MEKEPSEQEALNAEYGILCAKLGDLVIRGEINDRQMEEAKERLHKLQIKGKKLAQAAAPTLEAVDSQPEQATQ